MGSCGSFIIAFQVVPDTIHLVRDISIPDTVEGLPSVVELDNNIITPTRESFVMQRLVYISNKVNQESQGFDPLNRAQTRIIDPFSLLGKSGLRK